jgi:hypothetical protein
MLFKWIDKLGNKAFSAVKWILTSLSALLTSGFIIILES